MNLTAILRHPRRSAAVSSVFILMSGIMVVHFLFLQSWGIGSFPSITRRVERHNEPGSYVKLIYSPIFDHEGKPSFLQYAHTPAGRFMHIFPAGLWSVIAPLQVSPTFRAKHRTAHRRLGRLFILMSASMSFGLVPIVLGGTTKLRKSAFIEYGTLTIMGYFLLAGLLAVRHARNKRIAEHRAWMLRHVALGYSVHMQRLLGGLTWWIFPLIVPGYADHTHEGAQLRADVFGWYAHLGALVTVGSMEVWLRHTSPTGKVVQENAKEKITAKAA